MYEKSMKNSQISLRRYRRWWQLCELQKGLRNTSADDDINPRNVQQRERLLKIWTIWMDGILLFDRRLGKSQENGLEARASYISIVSLWHLVVYEMYETKNMAKHWTCMLVHCRRISVSVNLSDHAHEQICQGLLAHSVHSRVKQVLAHVSDETIKECYLASQNNFASHWLTSTSASLFTKAQVRYEILCRARNFTPDVVHVVSAAPHRSDLSLFVTPNYTAHFARTSRSPLTRASIVLLNNDLSSPAFFERNDIQHLHRTSDISTLISIILTSDTSEQHHPPSIPPSRSPANSPPHHHPQDVQNIHNSGRRSQELP